MKFTILTPFYWPAHGGTELSTRLVARYLARQGHDVTVLTSRMKSLAQGNPKNLRRNEHFSEKETHEGVRILRFPSGGLLDFILGNIFIASFRLKLPMSEWLFERHWLRRLRAGKVLAELRSDPPEVLFIAPCTDWLLKMGLAAARVTGAKLAVKTSLHLAARVLGNRNLRALAECDAVLANTDFEAGYLVNIGVPREKVHSVPVPFDIGSFGSTASVVTDPRLLSLKGKKFILYLGRKDKEKGVGQLAKIFESPSSALEGVTLVLAGASSEYFETEVRPRIKNNSSIIALDTVDEGTKMWLLTHCSVYSMVSSVDSFGLAYLEAWLSGAPVIAADLPAMRCVVRDGVDGLLVPYGDEARLREALSRFLSDPASAKRMAEAGRKKTLEEHGDHAVEKRIEKILMDTVLA